MMTAIRTHLVPLGVTLPQIDRAVVGGYFIWFSLPAPLTATELEARAREEEDVIVVQGALFGVEGDMAGGEFEREVRVCFSWEDEALLEESVVRLARVVRGMLERERGKGGVDGRLEE